MRAGNVFHRGTFKGVLCLSVDHCRKHWEVTAEGAANLTPKALLINAEGVG